MSKRNKTIREMSNRFNYLIITILYSVCMLFITTTGYAQSVFVNAPESVKAGEEFSLSIEFKGDNKIENASFKWNTTPAIIINKGPEINTSTVVSITNGKTSRAYTTTYTYYATAKESGVFKVDSIGVEYLNENNNFVRRDNQNQSEKTVSYSIFDKSFNEDAQSNLKNQDEGISPSYTDKKVSSIGKRTDNVNVLKYKSKSTILTNITGWCYNTSINKWSGNKNFIHSKPSTDTPDLISPVCYGLQVCEYSDNDVHYYILKWKGVSSLDKSSNLYFILNSSQYNSLRNLNSKGVIIEVGYTHPFSNPKSDDEEIREVLSQHVLVKFAARLDEGAVRFNFDEYNRTISSNSDGSVEFSVQSDKYTMQGYFEVTLSAWNTIF